MVGYSGFDYRDWNLEKNKIEHFRLVIFDENCARYQKFENMIPQIEGNEKAKIIEIPERNYGYEN